MPKKNAFSRMSVAELDRLIEQASRDRATRVDRAKKLAARVRTMAAGAGVDVADVVSALNGAGTARPKRASASPKGAKATKRKRRAGGAKGVKIAAKYRHPEDKSLTWSGRGVQARWIRDWIKEKKGRTLEDLVIGN
jgi:DNA-binding protein H-NS